MFDRVDVHCTLVSQKVLELLPDPLPEAPAGGLIVTEPGPGVFCDNAMDALIYPLSPKPDITQKRRWFKSAMSELVCYMQLFLRAIDLAICSLLHGHIQLLHLAPYCL